MFYDTKGGGFANLEHGNTESLLLTNTGFDTMMSLSYLLNVELR